MLMFTTQQHYTTFLLLTKI